MDKYDELWQADENKKSFLEHAENGWWWSFKPIHYDEGVTALYNKNCHCVIVCDSIYFKELEQYKTVDPIIYQVPDAETAWHHASSACFTKYKIELEDGQYVIRSPFMSDSTILHQLKFDSQEVKDVLDHCGSTNQAWPFHIEEIDNDSRHYYLVWVVYGGDIACYKVFDAADISNVVNRMFFHSSEAERIFKVEFDKVDANAFANFHALRFKDRIEFVKELQRKKIRNSPYFKTVPSSSDWEPDPFSSVIPGVSPWFAESFEKN